MAANAAAIKQYEGQQSDAADYASEEALSKMIRNDLGPGHASVCAPDIYPGAPRLAKLAHAIHDAGR
jgi:hypothetical protein